MAPVNVPAYLESVKIKAGYIDNGAQREKFVKFMEDTFGSADLIKNVSNNQVFLEQGKTYRNEP